MSHFRVLVFGTNVEKALAKYDENKRDKFTVEVKKAEVEEHCKTIIKKNKKSLIEQGILEKYEDYMMDKNYAQLISDLEGLQPNKKGDYGYYSNPNAHWDWYEIGGRWPDTLKLKPGATGNNGDVSWGHAQNQYVREEQYCDQALVKDIDWAAMKEEKLKEAHGWYDEFEAKLKADPEMKGFNPYFDFSVENTGTRENYIPETREKYVARVGSYAPLAIVHKGVWYERGSMGWWGIVTNDSDPLEWERKFEELLKTLPKGTLVTSVDCHI